MTWRDARYFGGRLVSLLKHVHSWSFKSELRPVDAAHPDALTFYETRFCGIVGCYLYQVRELERNWLGRRKWRTLEKGGPWI